MAERDREPDSEEPQDVEEPLADVPRPDETPGAPPPEPDVEAESPPEPAPEAEPGLELEPEVEPAPQPARAQERPARASRRESRAAAAAAEEHQTRIAFIGGTGPEGLGLAMRFARSGNMVFIGSRSEERAAEAVARVKEKVPAGDVFGGLNLEGAEKADIVFITVPWDAHEATLTELAEAIGDKILVDVVVPIVFEEGSPRAVDVEDGSAAQQARRLVPDAKIISGFHHLDASQLQKVDKPMQGDVLVCGDHKPSKNRVLDLVEEIEWVRALDAGALANSRYIENWTTVLISLNKIYKSHSGVRITGI